MNKAISIRPLTKELFNTYNEVGSKAYNQHYKHLWPNGNSSPYLKSSFTEKVLLGEENDPNTELFVIYWNVEPAGILKLSLAAAVGKYSAAEALLLNKIYLLNVYSGKGIGKAVLAFVVKTAEEKQKKVVWLTTMQKGPALKFYLQNGFTIYEETQIPFTSAIEAEKPMFIMTRLV
ncbi:MAG: GNAT family N-acetyltransferase [Flavobacteriaceae bacterium]